MLYLLVIALGVHSHVSATVMTGIINNFHTIGDKLGRWNTPWFNPGVFFQGICGILLGAIWEWNGLKDILLKVVGLIFTENVKHLLCSPANDTNFSISACHDLVILCFRLNPFDWTFRGWATHQATIVASLLVSRLKSHGLGLVQIFSMLWTNRVVSKLFFLFQTFYSH